MIPPPFTMTIDVGPSMIVVISATSLYNLVDKLNSSPVSKDLRERIKIAMAGKITGFPLGTTTSLLDGMVLVEAIYPQEWTTGKRLEWWKNNMAPPQSVYYEPRN